MLILSVIHCAALLLVDSGALLLIESAALLLSHSAALTLHLCEALLAWRCGALLVALWLREALGPSAEGGPDQVAGLAGDGDRDGDRGGQAYAAQLQGEQEKDLNMDH